MCVPAANGTLVTTTFSKSISTKLGSHLNKIASNHPTADAKGPMKGVAIASIAVFYILSEIDIIFLKKKKLKKGIF